MDTTTAEEVSAPVEPEQAPVEAESIKEAWDETSEEEEEDEEEEEGTTDK